MQRAGTKLVQQLSTARAAEMSFDQVLHFRIPDQIFQRSQIAVVLGHSDKSFQMGYFLEQFDVLRRVHSCTSIIDEIFPFTQGKGIKLKIEHKNQQILSSIPIITSYKSIFNKKIKQLFCCRSYSKSSLCGKNGT